MCGLLFFCQQLGEKSQQSEKPYDTENVSLKCPHVSNGHGHVLKEGVKRLFVESDRLTGRPKFNLSPFVDIGTS